jgi:alanyl-tRNA synthetase
MSGGSLVNAGSDKVIEIWNLVFIQFDSQIPDAGLNELRTWDQATEEEKKKLPYKDRDAILAKYRSFIPLPAKHVDTGMGFERITKVIQGKTSNYDTDVFTPIFAAIQKATGADAYTGKLDDLKDIAYRVIADHIRTLTFALTDGAAIGNDGRNYVLKRILRRAERYGYQVLGTGEPFLHELVPTVVNLMGDVFPELKQNPAKVREQIYEEEEAFLRNLKRGVKLFTGIADQMRKENRTEMSGKEAFTLHDTYGVIIDITEQMAQEQGFTVDLAGFEKELREAQERAKAGGKKFAVSAIQGELPPTDDSPKYGTAQVEAKLLGWVKDNAVICDGKLTAGESAALVLDRTGFYGEQGGQVGDQGTIHGPNGASFEVSDTQKVGDTVLHLGTLDSGELRPGDKVLLNQQVRRRIDIMRNHTATHLLNHALKQVLGGDVEQKGSLVDEDRTRFDFSHDKPLTQEQIRDIERRVNRQIIWDQPVTPVVMPLAEAKKLPGVRAVFGEKYPDPVRVIMVGAEGPERITLDNSIEFCGGTHVPRTGTIGFFKVVSQEAVAKGVRRITAVTGRGAVTEIQARSAVVDDLTGRFQCRPEELPARVEALQVQVKKLQDQLKKGAAADLGGIIDRLIDSATTVGGAKLIVGQLPEGTTSDAVRTQMDRIRQKCGSAFIVFGWTEEGGKVPLLAALTNDLVKKGIKAGDVVKQVAAIVGGSGGGKPDLAQAGGKDASKLPEAMKKAEEIGREVLGK